MKRALIIFLLLVIVVMVIIQMFFMPDRPTSDEQIPTTFPNGQQGTTGEVRPPERQLPELDTTHFEYLGDDSYRALSVENLGTTFYEIYYFPEGDRIIISLSAEPISVARELAEEDLAELLGVSKESLCFLPISVTTPRAVNEKYAGHDLGLSFCSGSTALE